MLLDALGLAALLAELDGLRGARVQDVVQPDRLSLTLELFTGARQYLTLSADPGGEGLRLSPERARRGAGAATPLSLAAHARLIGARLTEVAQPPNERVLTFTFQAEAPLTLVAELTGRLANLLLVAEDGTLLALARPVTAAMSRARVLLPGRPYAPPPRPDKRPADQVTEADLATWLAAEPTPPCWRVLVAHAYGLSPLAARELVHRASGDARRPAGEVTVARLWEAWADLFAAAATGRWWPCLARAGGRAVAYAPYQLTHLPGVAAMPSLLTALMAFEAERGAVDAYGDARAAVRASLDAALARAIRQAEALRREQAEPDAIEALRTNGELILAFAGRVRAGDTELVAGFDPARPERVPLDPRRTPAENAGHYFGRYRRLKRAAAGLAERLAAAEARRATLDQLATDLALATDRGGIDAVHDALVDGGYLPKPLPRRGAPVGVPLTWQSSDGFTVLVGRNSRQNERITFERATRGDPWLHARDVPGAHVVVKAAGRPVPARTLREAAALAAWQSRARDEASVAVAVTDVRHVRRLRGGGPGMVTFERAETLVVRPSSPEDLNRSRGVGALPPGGTID